MANLKPIEKKFFEDIFDMETGYVLDFTNITFAEFFRDTSALIYMMTNMPLMETQKQRGCGRSGK